LIKYANYLSEKIKYWKNKINKSKTSIVGHAEYMYETFREQLEKYNDRKND